MVDNVDASAADLTISDDSVTLANDVTQSDTRKKTDGPNHALNTTPELERHSSKENVSSRQNVLLTKAFEGENKNSLLFRITFPFYIAY